MHSLNGFPFLLKNLFKLRFIAGGLLYLKEINKKSFYEINFNSMQRRAQAFYFLFFCGLTVFAQSSTNFKGTDTDREQVVSVIEQLNQAMVDRDEDTLRNLTMEELTYGHSSGTLEDKKAFVEAVVHGDFDFTSTATENQTVFFSGDDTAVVRHIFLIEALSKGQPVQIRIGNMMVLKKQKKQWKLLARQAYKL
jgi:hypothetical protein